MQMVEWIFVIAIGLCLGSFATLASYRLPRGMGVITGRSHCPNCSKSLRAVELIPLMSWMISGARCKACKAPISVRYPLIELSAAMLCVIVYIVHGFSLPSILLMLASIMLLIMVISDIEQMIIPDEIHLALLVLGLGYHASMGSDPQNHAIAFIMMMGIGLLLHHGYYMIRGREGLGYGDVKFFAVAGLWLGILPVLPFLFLSGVLGVITGLLWKLRQKGEIFPFAPSLAIALWVCMIWPDISNTLLYMGN